VGTGGTRPMTDIQWKGLVNQVLYAVMFQRALDGTAVDETARNMIYRRTLRDGAGAYRAAAEAALGQPGPLVDQIPTRHSEEAFRDFLRRLVERLDALRPWPEPPFVSQPLEEWAAFADGRAIARVEAPYMRVSHILNELFLPIPGDDERRRMGVILRLADGRVVALVGAPGAGERVLLLQRAAGGDPAATIAAFRAATGLSADLVTPLT
jgi:hypothetical protein